MFIGLRAKLIRLKLDVMRYLNGLLLALMLLPLTSVAQNFTGSWEYHGPAESGMWLKTEQHGKDVRFQLELQRGAPSYNSGWIEGEFQLHGTQGVFSSDLDSGRCDISFRFSQKYVEISQDNNGYQCGFGYNVYAIGTLRLKSKQKPKFSNGDPRFE